MIISKYQLGNNESVVFYTDGDATDSYTIRLQKNWKLQANVLVANELISRSEVFYDFGANLGTFSIPLSLLSGARGLAVEANPKNNLLLEMSISKNNVPLKLLQGAVSGENGYLYFECESAYGHVVNEPKGIKVECFTANSVFQRSKLDFPALAKIDIEGSELSCLKGSPQFFSNIALHSVIIESNGPHCLQNNYMPQDLLATLAEYGYELYLIRGHKLIPKNPWDFQEEGNCDYLATRMSPESLMKTKLKIDKMENT